MGEITFSHEDRLTFDPEYHAYWWDGSIYVPSVTQIGDANGYTSDFCKSKSHADRGTEIHEMVELEVIRQMDGRKLKGDSKFRLEILSTVYPKEYQQFIDFCSDYGIKFTQSEHVVHGSLQYYKDNGQPYKPDWAGTKDLEGVGKNGQIYIIDIKTGKQPPPYTHLQTAAYTISSYPIGYEDIKRMALKLHADRKTYGTKPYDNTEDFHQWHLEVQRYLRNNPSQ
jgi:hypothetical protein